MKELKKLIEWQDLFREELRKNYPKTSEREQIFFLVAMHVFQYSKTETRLALIEKQTISDAQDKKLSYLLKELKKDIPIQYLLGNTFFYNTNLRLNKNVLIPRSETEELVHWILTDVSRVPKLRILDIGTGSGCIALSLKKELPQSDVYALDCSLDALKCARENARLNHLLVHFYQMNVLEKFPEDLPLFDVIVSNPPYVRPCEKKLMSQNVLKYEPAIALFVPEERPLIFYEKIASWSIGRLNTKGALYFEINQYLSKEVYILLEKAGYKNIQLRNDAQGAARMIKASYA